MLLKSYQSCPTLSGITYSITASSVILYVKMNLSPIQAVSLFDSVRDATIKLFVISQSITIRANLMTQSLNWVLNKIKQDKKAKQRSVTRILLRKTKPKQNKQLYPLTKCLV